MRLSEIKQDNNTIKISCVIKDIVKLHLQARFKVVIVNSFVTTANLLELNKENNIKIKEIGV